ncbi:MAG: serine--tRNA ligase [Flavobacteriaceae bacterium]|nr:serine--tRNA ligase [Flavobacteriaceae bacterium]
MLTVKYIREHTEKIIESQKKRGLDVEKQLHQILSLDFSKRSIQKKLNSIQAEINSRNSLIPQLIKSGQHKEAQDLIKKNSSLKKSTGQLSQEFQQNQKKLNNYLIDIPNIPHPEVPEGTTADHNVEIFNSGKIPQILNKALPHWELASKQNLIQFENGVKLSGRGFPVYVGKLAQLQRGLVNFFLDQNIQAGYKEYALPILVNEQSGFATGQLPDKEGQMYHIEKDNLYLIPTSEVPLTNLYRDSYLKESDLPIKMTSYTPCFRREAGSYGKDVKGLNRLHQFDKVEIVRIEKPENSSNALQEMIAHVKRILTLLELPFRVLKLCGGDLGFTASITYDFEVYSAAQEKWLEVSSVSNFESYQSNRLQLRYRDKHHNRHLLHTLNGSALALPRILACMIENFQDSTKLIIPKAVAEYTGFDSIEFSDS